MNVYKYLYMKINVTGLALVSGNKSGGDGCVSGMLNVEMC